MDQDNVSWGGDEADIELPNQATAGEVGDENSDDGRSTSTGKKKKKREEVGGELVIDITECDDTVAEKSNTYEGVDSESDAFEVGDDKLHDVAVQMLEHANPRDGDFLSSPVMIPRSSVRSRVSLSSNNRAARNSHHSTGVRPSGCGYDLNSRYSMSQSQLDPEEEQSGKMSRRSSVTRRMTRTDLDGEGGGMVYEEELRVSNIPKKYSPSYLKDLFNSFGKLDFMFKFEYLDHQRDGYVLRYHDSESFNRAYLVLGHLLLDGCHLEVEFVRVRSHMRASVMMHYDGVEPTAYINQPEGSPSTEDISETESVRKATLMLSNAFRPLKLWTSFLTLGTPKTTKRYTLAKWLFNLYCALVGLLSIFSVAVVIWEFAEGLDDEGRDKTTHMEHVFVCMSHVYLLALFIVDRHTLHQWKKFKVLTDYIHMEEEVTLLTQFLKKVMILIVTGGLVAFGLLLGLSLWSDTFFSEMPTIAIVGYSIGLFYLIGVGGCTIAMMSAYRFLINLLIKRFGKKVIARKITIQSMVFRYDDLALLLVKMTNLLSKSLIVTFGFGYPVCLFGMYVAIYQSDDLRLYTVASVLGYLTIIFFVYYFCSDPQLEMDNVLRNMTYMNCFHPLAEPSFFMLFLNQTQFYKAGIKVLGITLDRPKGVLLAYATVYICIVMLINRAAGGSLA
eukprot:Nk52_evm2s77 gene=Nk52_evmTU2s77